MNERINTLDLKGGGEKKEPLNELGGKSLEGVVFGEAVAYPYTDRFNTLSNKLKHSLLALVGEMPDDFFEDNEGNNKNVIFDREYLSDLMSDSSKNPYKLKLMMNYLSETLISLKKEKENLKLSKDYVKSLHKRIEEVEQKLQILSYLKDQFRNFYQIKKIYNEMADIQEAEPIKTLFSTNLKSSLVSSLEDAGASDVGVKFTTTITGKQDFMTWPDFFGTDAFVDYEITLDGEKKKGRIFIDGTKDIRKSLNNDVSGLGTSENKLIVSFSDLVEEQDMQSLGMKVGRYISELILKKNKALENK